MTRKLYEFVNLEVERGNFPSPLVAIGFMAICSCVIDKRCRCETLHVFGGLSGCVVVRGGGEETALVYEMYREPVFVRAIPILVC